MQNSKVFSKFSKRALLKNIISLLPFLFWVLLIFGFDTPFIAFNTIICALIHEGGHIFAAYMLKSSFSFGAVLSGFRIKGKNTLSYKDEIIIASAGPSANISVFILIMISRLRDSDFLLIFAILNLMTAISNLLPIKGYDGYRILNCLFHMLGYSYIPIRLLHMLSFLSVCTFSFISLYFMARLDAGYWIYFVFLSALIKGILTDKRTKSEKTRDFGRF